MALIQCYECGKQVSDKAGACPNCGCPLADARKTREVRVQLPNTQQISGGWVGLLSSKSAAIEAGSKTLWQGRHGQTASFEIDAPTEVAVNLGTWANPVVGTVKPGMRYQLVQDFGVHLKATYTLTEIDMIGGTSASGDSGTSVGFGVITEI